MDKNEEKEDSEFLHALDFYMEENSLNKSELSKRTGIPYTTIDGWYKKGPNGIRLNTLRKLSKIRIRAERAGGENSYPHCGRAGGRELEGVVRNG